MKAEIAEAEKLKADEKLDTKVISKEGLSLLEKRGAEQPEPYQRIYRHVKTVK